MKSMAYYLEKGHQFFRTNTKRQRKMAAYGNLSRHFLTSRYHPL